jgi:hypothetical protein
MPALLTDLVAFYRSFVVSIYYLWTQGNVRLPSGLTIVQLIWVCILAMGMPRFQAALCMTWPFFILCKLFCMRPPKVTTWSFLLSQKRACRTRDRTLLRYTRHQVRLIIWTPIPTRQARPHSVLFTMLQIGTTPRDACLKATAICMGP